MSLTFSLLLLLCVTMPTDCQDYDVYVDPYDPEDHPKFKWCVIFSVANGGNQTREDIETDNHTDSDIGCFVNGRCVWENECSPVAEDRCDKRISKEQYTERFVLDLQNKLEELSNHNRPVVIIRRPAEPSNDAGVKPAVRNANVQDWTEFDGELDRVVNTQCGQGRGLLLDFTSRKDPGEYITLGYLIAKNNLNELENQHSLDAVVDSSSIRAMAFHTKKTLNNLIFDHSGSFACFLDKAFGEQVAIPGPDRTNLDNIGYHAGGYTVKMYGSSQGHDVDAIQVAIPESFMDIPSVRLDKAEKFANGLHAFLKDIKLD